MLLRHTAKTGRISCKPEKKLDKISADARTNRFPVDLRAEVRFEITQYRGLEGVRSMRNTRLRPSHRRVYTGLSCPHNLEGGPAQGCGRGRPHAPISGSEEAVWGMRM